MGPPQISCPTDAAALISQDLVRLLRNPGHGAADAVAAWRISSKKSATIHTSRGAAKPRWERVEAAEMAREMLERQEVDGSPPAGRQGESEVDEMGAGGREMYWERGRKMPDRALPNSIITPHHPPSPQPPRELIIDLSIPQHLILRDERAPVDQVHRPAVVGEEGETLGQGVGHRQLHPLPGDQVDEGLPPADLHQVPPGRRGHLGVPPAPEGEPEHRDPPSRETV